MKRMLTRVESFREYAATCAETDYGSSASVARHNAAADGMRQLVTESKMAGPTAVSELFPLLDEPLTGRWLAFQLLELCELPDAVTASCLEMIRKIAAGPGAE